MRWIKLTALAAVASLAVRGDEEAATPTHSTKNSDAVQKRRARAAAKVEFEDENIASFDAYGRVIRYGMEIDDIECKRMKAAKGQPETSGEWSCRVTASSRRKYLTKEEKLVSKQMQADKQEEVDSAFGGTGAEAMKKKNK